MVNIWMIRWSLLIVLMFAAMVLPMWLMLSTEFDPETGDAVNFDLAETILTAAFAIIIMLAVSLLVTKVWAYLYWKRYSYEFLDDRIVIKRGVIGKKIANIQYERIQNVNIWKGILERVFGLHSIMIETAGGTQLQMGNYGAFSFSEGTIQGIEDPQPIVDYLMKRAKGGKDYLRPQTEPEPKLSKERRLELLEERLLKGEISEKTYTELKNKYGSG